MVGKPYSVEFIVPDVGLGNCFRRIFIGKDIIYFFHFAAVHKTVTGKSEFLCMVDHNGVGICVAKFYRLA